MKQYVFVVNEALNEINVEKEDYERLRESIDLHDNIDNPFRTQGVLNSNTKQGFIAF